MRFVWIDCPTRSSHKVQNHKTGSTPNNKASYHEVYLLPRRFLLAMGINQALENNINTSSHLRANAERELQSLSDLQGELDDTNKLLDRLNRRRARRIARGRRTRYIDRRIVALESLMQIANLENGGGGPDPAPPNGGLVVTLAKLASRALQDPRFDDL